MTSSAVGQSQPNDIRRGSTRASTRAAVSAVTSLPSKRPDPWAGGSFLSLTYHTFRPRGTLPKCNVGADCRVCSHLYRTTLAGRYIGSILAIRTYSPHSLMAVWNISVARSGVLIIGSAPASARNFLVSSVPTIWPNHALILSTIGLGVATGTITPHHSERSIGTPDSVMVGISGCDSRRSLVETARMRTRLARACASAKK